MSRKGQTVAIDWAETKMPAGEDPAWASFDYLKLRETLETIVAAMEASAEDAEIEQDGDASADEPESPLRLVVSNDLPESGESLAVDGPEKPAA